MCLKTQTMRVCILFLLVLVVKADPRGRPGWETIPATPSEKHLVEMDQAEQGIAEAFARTFGSSVVIPHDPPRQRLTATWLAVDGCNPADTMTIPS